MNDGHIRIGHAERERAAAALQQAQREGRLTPAELDDRLARAGLTRTRGELMALLGDVLGSAAAAELVGSVREQPLVGPGATWDDPLVITAKWDNEVRRGVWDVPPFLELNPVLSTIRLDFTMTRPRAKVIDISLLGGAGDVVLVLPGAWGAETRLVEKGMGSIKNEVVEHSEPGRPQIIVRGKTKMGSLKVRYPNRYDLWANRRAVARAPRRPQLGT